MRGEVRAGMPEAAGDRGARSVQERARLQIRGQGTGRGVGPAAAAQAACAGRTPNCGGCAGRAGAERTVNICCMIATLDVSQLSGWLNAAAFCRVERAAWEEGRHAGPGDGRGVWDGGGGASSVRREETQLRRLCWQGRRGAHIKHGAHVRDSGRVPAQRLVERRRALPSKKTSM